MNFKTLSITTLIVLSLSTYAVADALGRKSCDYINQWADFKSISVSYSEPDSSSEVSYEQTKVNYEKLYRVTVANKVDLQVSRIPGFTSYKSEKIPKEADCSHDLGETTSYLEGQIVRALYLLGRAKFDGPKFVEGKYQINLTVEKLMEKVIINPGTSMRIPGPWNLSGTLEKIDDNNIAFDFIQKVPGWNDERVKGIWSTEEKWPLPANEKALEGWKLCPWQSEESSSARVNQLETFKDLRSASSVLVKKIPTQ